MSEAAALLRTRTEGVAQLNSAVPNSLNNPSSAPENRHEENSNLNL